MGDSTSTCFIPRTRERASPTAARDEVFGRDRWKAANLANEVIFEGDTSMIEVIAPLRVDPEKKSASFEVIFAKPWRVAA